jgi:glucans biosynthesis protein
MAGVSGSLIVMCMASCSAIAVWNQCKFDAFGRFIGWAFGVFALVLCTESTNAADIRQQASKVPFGFDAVCDIAEQRLAMPFNRRVEDLPCELVGLDYDSWRYIAFDPINTVWRDVDFPFQVETGHRGYLFTQRVDLNEVTKGTSAAMPFNSHAFQYRNWLEGYRFSRTLGHSGWKLLARFNDERRAAKTSGKEVYIREVGSFLGASYFRLLGSQHVYGSSIRGLAVDCAMPHPEEFPAFTEFWLERPTENSTTFRCWALLESERVLGAYQFDISPDVETVVDVRVKLFIRGKIDKLGIAPMTSMWMWGGGTKPPVGDPRPEVHDADGLLVIGSDNSQLWRPLSRPSVPIVNHYAVPGLKGFGILQRNRDAKNYADSEALYHRRPSLYVEPKEAWPAGGVELLRLPASHEGIDNIGAFYLLRDPPQEGESIELQYRIHVCDDDKQISSLREATQSDRDKKPLARFIKSDVSNPRDGVWRIELVAETVGSRLEGWEEDQLQAAFISSWNESGRIENKTVEMTPEGVKVFLEVHNEPKAAFELLIRLNDTKHDLTEMWSYRCEP